MSESGSASISGTEPCAITRPPAAPAPGPRLGIGKPLDQIPGIILIIGAANQIQLAPVTGKTGGFNIKKEKLIQLSNPF